MPRSRLGAVVVALLVAALGGGVTLGVLSLRSGSTRARLPFTEVLPAPAPFEPTGWRTVWLDHLSYSVSNYKKSVSFYQNLLGWTPTYDEGSQVELLIGDLGNIVIRGGTIIDGTGKASFTGDVAIDPAATATLNPHRQGEQGAGEDHGQDDQQDQVHGIATPQAPISSRSRPAGSPSGRPCG